MPILNTDILRENMKNLMNDNNINQKQLGKEIHISQSAISKYLTGAQPISLNFLYTFAKHFNVTMDSLCEEPKKTTLKSNKKQQPLSSSDRIISICTALTTIFINGTIKTERLEKYETVYQEIIENGRETGMYQRAKGTLSGDPVNQYTSFYFSNYWELETTGFDSQADFDDYMLELAYSGNFNEQNAVINNFLKKLANLHAIYLENSMNYESYVHTIKSNLNTLIQEQTRK